MRTGLMRHLVAVTAAVAGAMSAGGQTPAPDPRAQDAIDAFMTFCVNSLASPVGAHAVLDGHPEYARPLASADLDPFFGPSAKPREGWLHKTAHDAWVALAYGPFGHGTCQMVIREADATATKSALTRAVDNYARLTRVKLDTKPSRQDALNGVPAETIAWEMTFPDTHRAAIIASVADQASGNKQALMTFALEH